MAVADIDADVAIVVLTPTSKLAVAVTLPIDAGVPETNCILVPVDVALALVDGVALTVLAFMALADVLADVDIDAVTSIENCISALALAVVAILADACLT